ncbi:MAG: phosphoribosylformylglycinamidine synthase I [Pirellulales bacterium]
MLAPRALILRAPGTNCDVETAYAFEQAGAITRRVHIRALTERPELANDFQVLCIPGGFSYGDDIASGRILALELKLRLGDTLKKFRDKGGLILGICNGFQVLLQTGLLLNGQATLAHNTCGHFVDQWVQLQSPPNKCVFLDGIKNCELPIAHAEGKFVTNTKTDLQALETSGQLVLRYAIDAVGASTNPNGSMGNVAGVCDETGRIFGLMPHPERFIDVTQHPAWVGRLDPTAAGAGLALFKNAVKAMA